MSTPQPVRQEMRELRRILQGAAKPTRVIQSDQRVLHEYACAALTGLLASGAHLERCDEDYVIDTNCRRAQKYAERMFHTRDDYGG